MHRPFIATPQDLERYLEEVAWRRYRVRLPTNPVPALVAQRPLTQPQVRAAVAALQARLSGRAAEDLTLDGAAAPGCD